MCKWSQLWMLLLLFRKMMSSLILTYSLISLSCFMGQRKISDHFVEANEVPNQCMNKIKSSCG